MAGELSITAGRNCSCALVTYGSVDWVDSVGNTVIFGRLVTDFSGSEQTDPLDVSLGRSG
jgi:hypothetical protein